MRYEKKTTAEKKYDATVIPQIRTRVCDRNGRRNDRDRQLMLAFPHPKVQACPRRRTDYHSGFTPSALKDAFAGRQNRPLDKFRKPNESDPWLFDSGALL